MSVETCQRLSKACKKAKGRVVGFDRSHDSHLPMIKRLRDLGFCEDSLLEVLHFGPLGADPVAVKLDGLVVALRRKEAALVHVEMEAA